MLSTSFYASIILYLLDLTVCTECTRIKLCYVKGENHFFNGSNFKMVGPRSDRHHPLGHAGRSRSLDDFSLIGCLENGFSNIVDRPLMF